MSNNNNDKEISVYLLGKDHGLFEKIFKEIEEISHKNEKENCLIKILKGTQSNSKESRPTKKLKGAKPNSNFIKKDDKNSKSDDKLLGKISKRFSITLIGYKYPELSKDNSKIIIYDIYNTIKSSLCKKNIIINFETSFINQISNLNNKIETDKPFILFNFPKEEDYTDNIFKNFKYPQYISYLILSGEKEPEKLYIKIISYILEKSCYYNEKGNELNKYLPNCIFKEPKGFLYLNIFLTGESRAGKSSFINRIFNKLVSFETPKLESATLKINSYEFYPSENEEKDNIIKNGYGGIKIFDTPGLVKTDNLNSFELIEKKLKKIYNEIHLVIFFIKTQSNLEQCIDMLKYINNINIKREKNNLNKIPIIFVKNGEDLIKTDIKPIIFQELKNQLQKYDLLDLYDSSINQNSNKKDYNIDDFFDEDNDENKNYDNYIDGNIIQIHIPTGKNINKIFSTTKEYIIKNNDFLYNKSISKIKNDTKKLIHFYIKEKIEKKSLSKEENKEKNELHKVCNNIVNDYKKNCSLLFNLDILAIKSKLFANASLISAIIISPFCIFIIPIFFLIGYILIYEENIINNIALKYGFGKKDLFDYNLNEYIYQKNENNNLKDEELKKKYRKLFEDILYYIGPIQCLVKSKEFFDQIINLLIDLNNKNEEEWNKFHVEKI